MGEADLAAAYAEMAADEARESEAEEWSDALLPDAGGQLAELRRRRAALDEDGDPGEPWEAVLDQIEARDP